MLPQPAPQIAAECEEFNRVESSVEDTLHALMAAFPYNRDLAHIHITVITISQLYSARVLSIDAAPLARHISSIPDLDDRLAAGDLSVVLSMYHCDTTSQKYYSFPTKFCSWHNPDAYSLWDNNVDEALWAYKKQDRFSKFKRQDLYNYPRLVEIVKEFLAFYGLSQSLKDVDKFLWRVGNELLKAKKSARATTKKALSPSLGSS